MRAVFNTTYFHGTVNIQLNPAMAQTLRDFISSVDCQPPEDRPILMLRASLNPHGNFESRPVMQRHTQPRFYTTHSHGTFNVLCNPEMASLLLQFINSVNCDKQDDAVILALRASLIAALAEHAESTPGRRETELVPA